ncbi:TPA: RdgB/HAM1 family non-canonical purine NTP pyrophosphatase [archaeon]|nr:RdgB/HAM1 family non-canonical purine NTP pyrophosphatase [Candidatus Undinarchaeales archaeon SRR5007147.bin71]
MKYCFASSNASKFREISEIFNDVGLELEHCEIDIEELQADTFDEIALHSARKAYEQLGKPVFVEDAGISVDSLGGFPGPFTKYVFYTIGIDGLLKLLEGVSDRKAEYISVLAYSDGNQEKVFKGSCRGSIAREYRGDGGWAWDPVFIPEGKDFTFGENYSSKKEYSHRAKSARALADWLKTNG